jgi:hypothetical protein
MTMIQTWLFWSKSSKKLYTKQMNRFGPGKALPGPWAKAGFGPENMGAVTDINIQARELEELLSIPN